MSYTQTISATYTYSTVDIETVVRRFTADIVMIAQSSGAITEAKAREYAHDIEALAKEGYLRKADLTLFSAGVEIKAVEYIVSTTAGDLTMSRPGGVMWPRVASPYLRIILSYTSAYDDDAKESMKRKLKIAWTPTSADTSHSALTRSAGRDYASNGWGLQRTDFSS